jgi:hypothetical protein
LEYLLISSINVNIAKGMVGRNLLGLNKTVYEQGRHAKSLIARTVVWARNEPASVRKGIIRRENG